MQRNILMILALCLTVFALVGCNEKSSGPAVAVVDAEKVFQESQLAQKGMAYLEELSAKFNERLAEMQAAVSADPNNEEQSKKFQAELVSLQGDFEVKQMDAATKLNKLFDEVVEEYRAKNDIALIVPAQVVITAREGVDITAEVIKLLDSKSLDYGPADISRLKGEMPKAGEAAAPADAPAAPAPAQSAPAAPAAGQ